MVSKIPPMLTMMDELIALPSISCVNPAIDQSNQAVIEKLANWCNDLGFHTDILPIPNSPRKFNLIATLGTGDGGLVLAGHTDTVPYNIGQWQADPFRLTERDNRLYGLGTADMKGFFAIALTVAAQFTAQQLRNPLILLATADEESTMSGARALATAGRLKARYAVIGEPTGLRPARMHKGVLMEAIRLTGLSGHSSDPSLGRSALEGMYRVICELLQWRDELQTTYRHPFFHVPVPTLNLGSIHGGDNPNRICGDCELHIDLRPLPGMDLQELRSRLRQRIQQVLRGTDLEVEIRPLFDGVPPMETPANTNLVQVAEHLTGHSAGAVAFGTEAPYLQALGIETIILGPGDVDQAHQPNEFLGLERLQPMTEILTRLVGHFCL